MANFLYSVKFLSGQKNPRRKSKKKENRKQNFLSKHAKKNTAKTKQMWTSLPPAHRKRNLAMVKRSQGSPTARWPGRGSWGQGTVGPGGPPPRAPAGESRPPRQCAMHFTPYATHHTHTPYAIRHTYTIRHMYANTIHHTAYTIRHAPYAIHHTPSHFAGGERPSLKERMENWVAQTHAHGIMWQKKMGDTPRI